MTSKEAAFLGDKQNALGPVQDNESLLHAFFSPEDITAQQKMKPTAIKIQHFELKNGPSHFRVDHTEHDGKAIKMVHFLQRKKPAKRKGRYCAVACTSSFRGIMVGDPAAKCLAVVNDGSKSNPAHAMVVWEDGPLALIRDEQGAVKSITWNSIELNESDILEIITKVRNAYSAVEDFDTWMKAN